MEPQFAPEGRNLDLAHALEIYHLIHIKQASKNGHLSFYTLLQVCYQIKTNPGQESFITLQGQ